MQMAMAVLFFSMAFLGADYPVGLVLLALLKPGIGDGRYAGCASY